MNYTALLHSHRLVVTIFLLLYVVKLVLLLANKTDLLATVTKKFKVIEMIISFLFFATGAAMLLQVAEIKTMMIVKLVLVFASIPLAVIGFKKQNKVLALLSILLIVGAYGLAEMSKRKVEKKEISGVITSPTEQGYDLVAHGKAVYGNYCQSCHGEDGASEKSGAKNLQVSTLTQEEMDAIIANGKNAMPPFAKVLSAEETAAVKAYVIKFRDIANAD